MRNIKLRKFPDQAGRMLNCAGPGRPPGGGLQTKIINTSDTQSDIQPVIIVWSKLTIFLESRLCIGPPGLVNVWCWLQEGRRSNNQLNYSRRTDWELFLLLLLLLRSFHYGSPIFEEIPPTLSLPFHLPSVLPSAQKELFFLGLRLQSTVNFLEDIVLR